jgi:DeoR/GlpR family transcriptional regulator of sugar metabolism
MLAEERLVRISEILGQKQTGVVSVAELSASLGVSPMTIRRDLARLEAMAVLRRVHGGALAYQGVTDWKQFTERHDEHSREKQLIGWTAAHFVQDNETIILDSGTTTPYVARHLANKRDLTVITHTLPVAAELSPYANVSTIVLGGLLRHGEMYTFGPSVLRDIARFAIDKLFLSAAGFSVENGATDPDPRECELKRAMVEVSREVILVADSSKWGKSQRFEIIPLRHLCRLVTDDGIPAAAVKAIEAAGVEVVTPSLLATSGMAMKAMGSN